MTAVWKTKDGREIPIKKMADTHLCNSMKMLERATDEKNRVDSLDTAAVAATLNGEMARDYAWDEADSLLLRTTEEAFPIYNEMAAEARRRGLAYKLWCVTCQQFHASAQIKCVEAYCKDCQKWHPSPVNDFHRRALGCKTITSSAP